MKGDQTLARRDGPVTGFFRKIKEGVDQAVDEVQRIRREDPVIATTETAFTGAVKTAASTGLAFADAVAIRVGKATEKFATGFEEVFKKGPTGTDIERLKGELAKAYLDSDELFEECKVPVDSLVRRNFKGGAGVMRDIVLLDYLGASGDDERIKAMRNLFTAPFELGYENHQPTSEEIEWRNRIIHEIWFPILKSIGGMDESTIDTVERAFINY